MLSKLKFFILLLSFLSFSLPVLAQEAGGEGGGNAQTPIQVIVQIVITSIILRILHTFNLP